MSDIGHLQGCSFGRTARCTCTYLTQWTDREHRAKTFRKENAVADLLADPGKYLGPLQYQPSGHTGTDYSRCYCRGNEAWAEHLKAEHARQLRSDRRFMVTATILAGLGWFCAVAEGLGWW